MFYETAIVDMRTSYRVLIFMHRAFSVTTDSINPQVYYFLFFHDFSRLASFADVREFFIPYHRNLFLHRMTAHISAITGNVPLAFPPSSSLDDRKYSYDSRTSYEEMRARVSGV